MRVALAQEVAKLQIGSTAKVTTDFLSSHPNVHVITANYDHILEEQIAPQRCNSNYPGKPITRLDGQINVDHFHGSVKSPSGMVVTTNDYYRFINEGGYFAQKLFTLLHENTTVMLGYSLSDPNLKAIINRCRPMNEATINRGHLYFVTRHPVPISIRDFYEASYGITVLAQTDIDALFLGIEASFDEARKVTENAKEHLHKVLLKTHWWNADYIALRSSIFHIMATAQSIGVNLNDENFVAVLQRFLAEKQKRTEEYNAFSEYENVSLPRYVGQPLS